ncbi:MAG TPA: HAMP domain-containing protein [Arcobacter sp.]|nr:HAMP domain-containing protein [Arcobacter sp.]
MNLNNIKIKLLLWYSAIILLVLATLAISIAYVFGKGSYNTLEELEHILFLTIPIIVLLFILSGWFIVNNVLKRVQSVIDEVENIKADDLEKRLDTSNSNDEIEKLIVTFNSMLGRLENSFSKIKRFSHDVSHELKTPLTVVMGEIELGLRKDRTKEEYKEILKTLHEETKQQQELIDSLLFLSNSNEVQIKEQFTELDLDELIIDTISANKHLSSAKKIKFEFFKFENVKVQGHTSLLKILLTNIIQNSIKYSNKNSKIEICLDENSFTIKDYGIGIKKEDLSKIFDRFYRVDESRARGGHGLGLSIVKSISILHNFKIELTSKYDEYTKVTIIF